MGKYYAVRVGRRPGIYDSWDEVKALVNGYAGAQHKSFKSLSEAEAYLAAGPSSAIVGVKRTRDDYGSDDDGHIGYGDAQRYRAPSQPHHNSYLANPGKQQPYSRQPSPPLGNRQAYAQPMLPTLIVERPSSYAATGGAARGGGAYGSDRAAAQNYQYGSSSSRAAGAPGGGGGSRPGGGRFDPVVDGPLHTIRSDVLYQLEFDGAARGNPGEAGCGAVLRRQSDGVVVCRLRKYMGSPFTNNEAEYTALLEGLKMARRLGVTRLEVSGDSKLVVQQVQGNWRINKEHLQGLCSQVLAESRQLAYFKIKHVLREWNADADKLSNDAIDLAYR